MLPEMFFYLGNPFITAYFTPETSSTMNRKNPYRKFQAQQEKIQNLEKTSSRFKRVYNEYALMSEELWNLENAEGEGLPDDFINSIILQTSYLEEEIEDWLSGSVSGQEN